MGDRAMAQIKTEGGSLYVYTHWGGYDLPQNAMLAIQQAKPRWNDEAYAVFNYFHLAYLYVVTRFSWRA